MTSKEHFGIVPIESLAVGRPVITCGTGGPSYSILHGKTGHLAYCNSPHGFAYGILQYILNPKLSDSMETACRQRFENVFALDVFGKQLLGLVEKLI